MWPPPPPPPPKKKKKKKKKKKTVREKLCENGCGSQTDFRFHFCRPYGDASAVTRALQSIAQNNKKNKQCWWALSVA